MDSLEEQHIEQKTNQKRDEYKDKCDGVTYTKHRQINPIFHAVHFTSFDTLVDGKGCKWYNAKKLPANQGKQDDGQVLVPLIVLGVLYAFQKVHAGLLYHGRLL